VSPSTRKAVLAAVRELGYRPPPVRSGDYRTSEGAIAVVVPELARSPVLGNPFFSHVLDGILEVAGASGWSVSILAERTWSDDQEMRLRFDGRTDGAILLEPSAYSLTARSLVERGIPTVVVGAPAGIANVSTVSLDEGVGASAALTYLVGLGHRRVAYVPAEVADARSTEQWASIQAEATALKMRKPRGPLTGGAAELRKVVEADRSLPIIDRLSSALCANDLVAETCLRELEKAGLAVPADFSIVSLGAVPSGTPTPEARLTAIRAPLARMGQRAATLLMELVQDPYRPSENVRFGGELQIAGTTQAVGL